MNDLLATAQIGEYHGYERRDFWFSGHMATVIFAKAPTPQNRWIWRAEFLGSFDTVDLAMLAKGYHLVYYSLSNQYGSPQAVERMKEFYDFAVRELHFADQTILFGFSRGGLYSVNFALAHPKAVCALYLDAPVLDLKSWPCHLNLHPPLCHETAECLQIYGLTLKTLPDFRQNPIDRVDELLTAGIPVAVVAGDADPSVPHLENCQRLIDAYERAGGKYLYILKPGCAHHPHSLEDPTPVVEFLLQCAR